MLLVVAVSKRAFKSAREEMPERLNALLSGKNAVSLRLVLPSVLPNPALATAAFKKEKEVSVLIISFIVFPVGAGGKTVSGVSSNSLLQACNINRPTSRKTKILILSFINTIVVYLIGEFDQLKNIVTIANIIQSSNRRIPGSVAVVLVQ